MKAARTLLTLLLGIAALVGAHVCVDMHTRQAPSVLRRNALLPMAETMTAFAVTRTNEPPIRLRREARWKLVSPYGAEAETSVILRLSDALAFVPIADGMTAAELLRLGRTSADFGLDAPRVELTVVSNAGVESRVLFGRDTPNGDGVYAATDRGDSVYVVPTNVFAAVNLKADDFRRRRIFDVTAEAVEAIDVRGGVGRFVRLAREGGVWKIAEPRPAIASSAHVRAFLDGLIRLESHSIVWSPGASNEAAVASTSLLAGYGLDSESSVAVALKCSDGSDRVISLGRESTQGRVYALIPGGAAIVTVDASVRAAASAGMDTFVDTRLFPFDASALTAVSLEDGGAAYLLARGADRIWHLDAPVAAPAEAPVVDRLLTRLLALKASDVAADGIRISVGTNVASVAVSRASLLDGLRLDDLRARDMATIEPSQAKRVVVTDRGATAQSVALDGEKGSWIVESGSDGGRADGAAIQRLLATVNPLRAQRVVRLKVASGELGAYGLDRPARTVAIDRKAADSLRCNIRIGDVTDGGRFATVGAADAVFVISPETSDALLAPILQKNK